MVPSRTVALTLQLIVIATIVRHDSGEIITKDFTKTDMSGSVIDLSGYNQLQAVSRKLDCAKQCSEDDTCSNFYYTSSEHICYLSGSSTSHVYRIQAASFAFYKLNDGALGCPVNEGGWFVLEKDSNIMFSLFTTTEVNFQDAVDHCATLDAHPLQILTDDKMSFILANLIPCADVYGHHFWVDATNALAPDPSSLDAFRTSDNKVFPITGGPFWEDQTGPNDGTYQPLCVWIPTFFNYKFDDIPCVYPNVKHICEKLKT